MVRILFINTPNEGCKTFPVRHRATVSFADTDDSVVLTRYVTGNQFLCAVQTEQLMILGVKFGFTWKRTH